ncbi:MAG: peptidoglycan DD-metalloendopeptidase family protein [Chloroflexota bacterium]
MSTFRFEVWPTEHRVITQHFGANPRYYSQFGLPGHEGVDIRAPSGSKIFCVAPGRIYNVHRSPTGHNYGIHVRVQHQDGFQSIYGHMEEIFVNQGETVAAGAVLGLADNTGNSFGSHLHLSLKRKGQSGGGGRWPHDFIDPTPYLFSLLTWAPPAGPYIDGYINSNSLRVMGKLAQIARDDAYLHIARNRQIPVPEGTIVIVTGKEARGYYPVKVAEASVGINKTDLPSEPAPPPSATMATVYGWAWSSYLNLNFKGDQGIVNTPYGIHLRSKPTKDSTNIGVIRRGSTVQVLGEKSDGYLRIQVRRADFVGPVNIPGIPAVPETSPQADPIKDLPDGVYLGWIITQFLRKNGTHARLPHRSVSLRSSPGPSGKYIGTVRGDATVTLAGIEDSGFTPVLVSEDSFLRRAEPAPLAKQPAPFSPDEVKENIEETDEAVVLDRPFDQSRSGWVLTGEIKINGNMGIADHNGLNLRTDPRRNGEIIGFIPPKTPMLITDKAQGEFSPVRIEAMLMQPPIQNLGEVELISPDPPVVSRARIGLHASADPHITEEEHREFHQMRPGIIKVLSFHSAADIARLAREHPKASFIVRAFLDFGDRRISADQFLTDTLPDVRRALNQLRGRDVVVELHNEPNLSAEGLGRSWRNGTEFNKWWLDLLQQYRRELPTSKFIYPGLSPGHAVVGQKADHIQFIEASRDAVEEADGLGVHLYWSEIYPMSKALEVLDDYQSRFRNRPVWITEASNNKPGPSPTEKAQQYLRFWNKLQERPMVEGVTYFVASASNPAFKEEIWVGRNIGRMIGLR